MNRHARRAESYALIEMRMPIPPDGSYPTMHYTGGAAMDRARRFAASYLAGYAEGRAEASGEEEN